MGFTLHPRLAADCVHVRDLGVCRVLLMNDQRFPWLILVPMRNNIRELFELAPDDYRSVMEEIRHVSQQFARHTAAHKINIAALGNVVPQLHIHIICRFEDDAAWPNPVWNCPTPHRPYPPVEIKNIIDKLQPII